MCDEFLISQNNFAQCCKTPQSLLFQGGILRVHKCIICNNKIPKERRESPITWK